MVPSCTLITSHCYEPLEKLQDKLDQCSSLPQIGVCLAMHCMHTDGIFLGLGKNYPNAKLLSKSVIFVTKLCQYNQDLIPYSGITVWQQQQHVLRFPHPLCLLCGPNSFFCPRWKVVYRLVSHFGICCVFFLGHHPCFIVFDMLVINEKNLANVPLSERIKSMEKYEVPSRHVNVAIINNEVYLNLNNDMCWFC